MVTEVFKINEILDALEGIDVVAVIAEGFKALSQGKVDIPPIGEMLFPCLLYTSPSPRDGLLSRMPSSA